MKKIKESCLLEFTSLMSILLSSSLNLKDALDICRSSSERDDVRRLAAGVSAAMERGSSFLSAIETSGSLPPVYSGLVRIGEKTGDVTKAFGRLADYLTERKKLNDGLSGAMIYPLLILGVAALGGSAVGLYALPKLREVFSELGGTAAVELDRSMASGARAALALALGCALALVAWVTALALKRKSIAFAVAFDKAIYTLPFFGSIARSRCLLDFSFSMESLLSAGIPLDEAMTEASKATSNVYFSEAILSARERACKGFSLNQACAGVPAFPGYMTQWLAVGERTGKPQEIFGRLRAYYQAMVDKRAKAMMALIEPGASILIGAAVLYMVFTFVIPLFKAMGSLISVQ